MENILPYLIGVVAVVLGLLQYIQKFVISSTDEQQDLLARWKECQEENLRLRVRNHKTLHAYRTWKRRAKQAAQLYKHVYKTHLTLVEQLREDERRRNRHRKTR